MSFLKYKSTGYQNLRRSSKEWNDTHKLRFHRTKRRIQSTWEMYDQFITHNKIKFKEWKEEHFTKKGRSYHRFHMERYYQSHFMIRYTANELANLYLSMKSGTLPHGKHRIGYYEEMRETMIKLYKPFFSLYVQYHSYPKPEVVKLFMRTHELNELPIRTIKYIIGINPDKFYDLNHSIQMNPQIRKTAVGYLPELFRTETQYHNDETFLRKYLSKTPELFQYASEKMRDLEELARIAVSGKSDMFRYVSMRLRDRDELARIAVSGKSDMFRYVSKRLQMDVEFLTYALKCSIKIYKMMSKEMQVKVELVRLVGRIVQDNVRKYKYLPHELRKNLDVLLPLIRKDYRGISYRLIPNSVSTHPLVLRAFVRAGRSESVPKEILGPYMLEALIKGIFPWETVKNHLPKLRDVEPFYRLLQRLRNVRLARVKKILWGVQNAQVFPQTFFENPDHMIRAIQMDPRVFTIYMVDHTSPLSSNINFLRLVNEIAPGRLTLKQMNLLTYGKVRDKVQGVFKSFFGEEMKAFRNSVV